MKYLYNISIIVKDQTINLFKKFESGKILKSKTKLIKHKENNKI